MAVWIRVVLIFVIILIGNICISISAYARAKAKFGEQFVKEMRKDLDKIALHKCTTTEEVCIDIAELRTWDKAFDVVKRICDV